MKASEAIKQLQSLIERHGDLEIWADQGMTHYSEPCNAAGVILNSEMDGKRFKFADAYEYERATK